PNFGVHLSAGLADDRQWQCFLERLYRKNWVVYAKPPFGGPQQVFRYLGRYTHRVAIANHRIVGFERGQVTFTWKDYKDGARRKTMALSAIEFLRRFLLHILPQGFTRIRHFGPARRT
ncbi:MAG: transposase, partial [Candidatus Eisenbacteria sp.]|nr:transposase [Candidatus Eisenbacteria bacterium]